MAEQTLWSGTSSQLKNLGWFLACLLVIPIPWAIYKWLETKSRVFRLTSERLLVSHGILSKTEDSLELYRVRDIQVTQPFWLRLTNLQNVQLITADTSTPSVMIDCVPVEAGLADKFRAQVEECRLRKRVRGLDVDGPVSMDESNLG